MWRHITQWLQDLRADHRKVTEQKPVTITIAHVQQWIKNMKSWTALGPDMIHPYWLKHLTAVHERLAALMNQLLASAFHPSWLTQRRTALVMKDSHKGTTLSNYGPITCLTKKVLSGIIAAKLQVHMTGYMSTAQKGIGNNTRGSKHQLLIERAVTNDSRSRPTWAQHPFDTQEQQKSAVLETAKILHKTLKLPGLW